MPGFKSRLTASPRMPSLLCYHSDHPEACLTLRSGVMDLTMRVGARGQLRVPVLSLTFSSATWCRALCTVLLLSLRFLLSKQKVGVSWNVREVGPTAGKENECLYLLTHNTHNMHTRTHTHTPGNIDTYANNHFALLSHSQT